MATYNEDPTQGAIKHDADKVRLELLPPISLWEIAKVMSYGKYPDYNWCSGSPSYQRYFAAAQRHLLLWQLGEDKDKDTGLSHIAHAACNIVFLLHLILFRIGTDDRPAPFPNPEFFEVPPPKYRKETNP